MREATFLLVLFIFVYSTLRAHSLICHSCEGGPHTNCAKVLDLGASENCDGPNAQCYEALVKYQNGALTLVQRRCWQPPEGSNQTDFCKAFKNPVGKLGKCITCKKDLCNTDKNFWVTRRNRRY